MDKETAKKNIIKLFQENVKDQPIILTKHHNGSEGHWLESKMNIEHNCKNQPDIYGYEMKKDSKKISFGDFGASEYLFSKNKPDINEYNKSNIHMTRNDFMKYFGHYNESKSRYSWSGSCVPKYGVWNDYGQILQFTENNDLCIYYSYEKDKREHQECLPDYLKNNNTIMICIWKYDKLKTNINKKFNTNGFFICKKIYDTYQKICFGIPFNVEHFITKI